MNKAIFIDKDGTLIHDVPYNTDPALIRLEPGVAEGLQLLVQQGYLVVIISNQSGVAMGYFTEDALEGVKEKIRLLLEKSHIPLNGFYYCPHHPEGVIETYRTDCNCRKPAPGLIEQAAKELRIDPAASWMIGDILHDVEAGNRAGCRTVLINNGNETEWIMNAYRTPTFVATDVQDAASLICSRAFANDA